MLKWKIINAWTCIQSILILFLMIMIHEVVIVVPERLEGIFPFTGFQGHWKSLTSPTFLM